MWTKFILILGITSWILVVINSSMRLLEKKFEQIIEKKFNINSSK